MFVQPGSQVVAHGVDAVQTVLDERPVRTQGTAQAKVDGQQQLPRRPLWHPVLLRVLRR